MFVSPSLCCFLWLYLLSIFGLESFCFFFRMRSSFANGVLVMVLRWRYVGCPQVLGFARVPSSEFLGLVASWLSNL